MFTGIIEEIGRMEKIAANGQTLILTVKADQILSDMRLGDSIAVNGVCLTVVDHSRGAFSADVMPETFRRTNLRKLAAGSPVNLERAMSHGGRFGGHIVQGHIDTTGAIAGRREEENAVLFRIVPDDAQALKYIVSKGSIALDGISLTVVAADEAGFTVSIIPHTLGQTILKDKTDGDSVNIECDILGKYVERLLFFQHRQRERKSPITEQFLSDHGFI